MDEAFFRARYEADAANRARQSWDEYWSWVRTFYEGKRFPPVPGWRDRERDGLARVADADRAAVQAAFAETGRAIAAEWAKDNAVRRVSTDDLKSWGKSFSDAAGDAKRLLAALGNVRETVAKRAG